MHAFQEIACAHGSVRCVDPLIARIVLARRANRDALLAQAGSRRPGVLAAAIEVWCCGCVPVLRVTCTRVTPSDPGRIHTSRLLPVSVRR